VGHRDDLVRRGMTLRRRSSRPCGRVDLGADIEKSQTEETTLMLSLLDS
jgi:hypothetical protein